MTDLRDRLGPRYRPARAFAALAAAAAVGLAAAGCGGSSGGSVSSAAASAAGRAATPTPAPASASAPASAPASGSGSASTAPSSTTAGSTASAADVVIYDCKEQPVSRPGQFVLACGDGTSSLQQLQWADWGGARAGATGMVQMVVCVPSCAAGAPHDYRATVTVSGLSQGRYTEMTVSAPGAPTPEAAYSLGTSGPTRIGMASTQA